MSRFLDDSATQYLAYTSAAPISTFPITMSCWIYPDDLSASMTIMWTGDKDVADSYIALRTYNSDADKIQAITVGDTAVHALSTSSAILNTWQHTCAAFVADNERHVWHNGGNKGSSTANKVTANRDGLSIGYSIDSTPGYPFSGAVAEAAIWDVLLTDVEVRLLALGCPPWLIRPNHLCGFWLPFGDRTDRDYSGRGYHLSAYNTPTWGADPPAVVARYRKNRYRRTDDRGAPWWRTLAAVPIAADAMPMAMDHYRRMRV